MTRLRLGAALCALALSGLASACTASIAGDPMAEVEPGDPEDTEPGEPEPGDPEPDPSDPIPEPEPEPEPVPGFDVNDPADYRWTLKLESFYTLEVLRGSALVQWARYAPGVDPQSGTASASGTLAEPTLLAEDLSFYQLTTSTFAFRSLRQEDGHPMTSCLKLVEASSAIESHNEILVEGYPLTDPTGFTNPEQYAAHLDGLGGVLLFVNGDCATPSADNPTELRSVLSFAAVTFTATPDPEVYDAASDPDPAAGIHPDGA